MKSFTLILCVSFSFFSGIVLSAQNVSCDNTFFYPKIYKKLTYINYTADSILKSMQEETVLLITNTKNGFEAIVSVNDVNALNTGRPPSEEYKVRCEDGDFKISLSSPMSMAQKKSKATQNLNELPEIFPSEIPTWFIPPRLK